MTFHFLNVLDLEAEAERRLLGSKRTRAVEVARVLSLGGKRVCVEKCWDGLYGLSFKAVLKDDAVERFVERWRVQRVHRVMVRSLFRGRV